MPAPSSRAAGALLLALLLGCTKTPEPMPTTHPVTGIVTYKQGGPVAGGRIAFQPMTDTQMACNSAIADDGTYAISTLRTSDQQRIQGMPEGEYRVTIFPPSTDQFILPTDVPGKVVVKAGENKFDFKIDKTRPR